MLKTKSLSFLGVVALSSLIMANAFGAEVFTVDMEAAGSIQVADLAFGVDDAGGDVVSNEFDPGLDVELAMPPGPPSFNEIYFSVNGDPDKLWTDYRPVAPAQVWTLEVSLLPDAATTLSWTLPASGYFDDPTRTLEIVKGGTLNFVDMKTTASIDVSETSTYYIVYRDNVTNIPPTAVDDQDAMLLGETSVTIPVLANDFDGDGEAVSVVGVDADAVIPNGSAAIDGDNIIFTPDPGFSGIEYFGYVIEDPQGSQASAVVTVHVNEHVSAIRSHDTTAFPGSEFTVNLDIAYTGPLASLKIVEVLPTTDEMPPSIWQYVAGSIQVGSVRTLPTVSQNGTELTIDFGADIPTSPISLSYKVTVPESDIRLKALKGELAYELTQDGTLLTEDIPTTKVLPLDACLDLDNSADGAFYNLVDVRLLFNYQFGGGKYDDLNMVLGTPYEGDAGTGIEVKENVERMISKLDIDGSADGAFFNLVDVRIIFNYQFGGGKYDDLNMVLGTPYEGDANKGAILKAAIEELIGN